MTELDIGRHCSFENCNQLDFLPIECDKCDQIFCKIHYVCESHNCPVYKKHFLEAAKKVDKVSFNCSKTGCGRKELVEVICPCCKLHFCLLHRHPQDHECQNLETYTNKMVKTKKLVESILKNSEKNEKKPAKLSEKAKATAAKVALMKIKQKAVGVESLPQNQRIYLKIKHQSHPGLYIFLDREWSVGRSIDDIAKRMKITNENNTSNGKVLFLSLDGQTYFDTSSKWNDLLKDNVVFDASEITLNYV